MRFRTKHSLLLLLPPLAAALADVGSSSSSSLDRRDAATAGGAIDLEPDTSGTVNQANSGTRREVPTKDAPVDGRDGKPHLGPFVETDGSPSTDSGGDLSDLTLDGKPSDWETGVDGKKIPESNDGVMFDKNRERPLEGTTGTKGGVTEKDNVRKVQEGKAGGRLQTQPEAPKEQPPLPHSEEEKIKSATTNSDSPQVVIEEDDDTSYTGLDKPDDLPETPQHSLPVPDGANKDHLDLSAGSDKLSSHDLGDGEDEEGIIQPFHSFILSLTMILFSEVGDKTFLVAALMAMKHDRMVVFSAAFGALLVMTVLSALLGHTVPALIPKRVTSFAAAGLFFVFGAKLLYEGLQMDPNEGVGAEMSEVEQELAMKEKELGRKRGGSHSTDPFALEMGLGGRRSRSRTRFPSPPRSPSQSPSPVRATSGSGSAALSSFLQGFGNLVSLLLSPAWVQTFVMTFLGEWGDRSQIATIAMAAGQDYWWVTLGAMVGHAFCTGAAVIGGRAIAGRVSLKVVTVGGAAAFIVFGFIYFFEAVYG